MKQNLHLGEMLKQSLADKLTQLEKEVFDIGALVPIMEVLQKRYKLRLETVGNSAKYYVDTRRYHVTESDEPIIEIGEVFTQNAKRRSDNCRTWKLISAKSILQSTLSIS
jgi:chorismate-pyruvate lyase